MKIHSKGFDFDPFGRCLVLSFSVTNIIYLSGRRRYGTRHIRRRGTLGTPVLPIHYTKLEAHRHIGGDADNAIASYRKVLGVYDVGFSETFTEFFSETFERLVSIALARLDFNRHNLEFLSLWRIHPLCRTSGATILALHERAIRLFSE